MKQLHKTLAFRTSLMICRNSWVMLPKCNQHPCRKHPSRKLSQPPTLVCPPSTLRLQEHLMHPQQKPRTSRDQVTWCVGTRGQGKIIPAAQRWRSPRATCQKWPASFADCIRFHDSNRANQDSPKWLPKECRQTTTDDGSFRSYWIGESRMKRINQRLRKPKSSSWTTCQHQNHIGIGRTM